MEGTGNFGADTDARDEGDSLGFSEAGLVRFAIEPTGFCSKEASIVSRQGS